MAISAGALEARGSHRVGSPRPPTTPDEHEALLEGLATPDGWPAAAAALLANLGFRLVHGHDDTWHLLIALRERPTFGHFDPELVRYYALARHGGADVVSIDRGTLGASGTVTGRGVPPALWGHVHVIDRIPVENRFLTFGGTVRVAVVSPSETVVDIHSVAPIVRWGGHSQGTDELAEAIGAFFGRLIVPINFVPGAAARIDALAPGILYRAFLADGLARAAAAERRGLERAAIGTWIASAWRRARADEPACDAAQRLLRELALA